MRWLVVVAVVLLVLLGLVWLTQRRLVYFPTQAVPAAHSVLPGAEEVTYPTEDGLELDGWFVPPARPLVAGTVVVFNGNAGNRAHRAPLAAALA